MPHKIEKRNALEELVCFPDAVATYPGDAGGTFSACVTTFFYGYVADVSGWAKERIEELP